MLEKFPRLQNCIIMDPPKLNLEIKVALASSIQKRDKKIVAKQEEIVAGMGKIIELVLKLNRPEKKQYLQFRAA